MWWVKVSAYPGELRAPCGGSPCVPTHKCGWGFRDRQGPLATPLGNVGLF